MESLDHAIGATSSSQKRRICCVCFRVVPHNHRSDHHSETDVTHGAPTSRGNTDDRWYVERRLPWPSHRKKRSAIPPKTGATATLVILPPCVTNVEYAWEGRLIRLEHARIQAQSVAGLYSTLGGGYFMTRRLRTAAALAHEQKRIALLLGNKEMYYKCTINQAYSEIYAGRFQSARRHILQVWLALAHEKHFDEKVVLQNMCQSAMLFRQRVRAARRQLLPHPAKGTSPLVDDFSRIRVVEDQSSHHDLMVAPMARAKIVS